MNMNQSTPEVVSDREGGFEIQPTTDMINEMSVQDILKAIASALASGNISSAQAKSIRRDLGITQATFTRKQRSPSQRKALRLTQKESRRRNRGTGKGQRQSGRL
jgi:hypothetical protein